MYYHPSMFSEIAQQSPARADKALLHALLRGLEHQQRVQMSTLELVRRLRDVQRQPTSIGGPAERERIRQRSV